MIDEKELVKDIFSIGIVYSTDARLIDLFLEMVNNQPKVGEWIPFTLEENFLNCPLPEEDQEILVTDGRSVWTDTFCRDGDDCYLDGGYEFVAEVTAWQPKPEPPHFGDVNKMVTEEEGK